MSSGGSKSKAEEGITAAGNQLYDRGKQTGEEASQYQGSFDIGNILKSIMYAQMGLGSVPSGLLSAEEQYKAGGPLAQTLYEQVLSEAQDPYAYYESTLQPQLQLAEDYINRQAQRRGLIRSGIPIEQMGRAGVELAIQEAAARQQARQNALQQAYSLGQTAYNQGQQNLTNLSNLYGTQQQAGLTSMSRQAQAAAAAAPYAAYPYQAQLGSYYGTQAGNQQLLGTGIQTLGTLGAAAILKSSIKYKTNVRKWVKR